MGLCCREIVLQVAGDSQHEFQAPALFRMEFFFDLPVHESLKIAALAHPDPRVREAGAYVLCWDEPIKAEGPLIALTSDAVPEVAAEACQTLKYYPSLRTLRCLHERRDHAVEKVRNEALDSFADIRQEILYRLRSRSAQVVRRIREWVRPLWDVLAFDVDELCPKEDEPSVTRDGAGAKAEPVIPVVDLWTLLTDPNASPLVLQERLTTVDWCVYWEGDRRRLRPLLLTHADQLVRGKAAHALTEWEDVDGLVTLMGDQGFLVRKSAMYGLSQLPSNGAIAALAWTHLGRGDTLGVHATETLACYVHHEVSATAIPRLVGIAADPHQREQLRTAAVCHLVELDAEAEIVGLAGCLKEPPSVAWALHTALLDALQEKNIPKAALEDLRAVDNLDVQEAVAQFDDP
jgi:hypothetical protein